MRTARTLACLALLLMAAGASAAPTALPPLTGTLTMSAGRARTEAPVWLDVELNNHTAGLIEGQLDISFFDGQEPLGHYRGWDMALADGPQHFRIMLPQPASEGGQGTLDVRMQFVTAKGPLDLGWQLLSVAPRGDRVCVVAVGGTDRSSTGAAGLMRSLQLERYDPERSSAPDRRLTTFPAATAAEDFPVDPLGYCAYDIVLLPADAFALVHQRQLEALESWVEAGGSVCVLPGADLKPYQVDFLKALAGGKAVPPAGVGFFRCGLGRAVVATQMPEALDSAEWRAAVAFLWKLRSDRLRPFTQEGRWEPKPAAGGVHVPAGLGAVLSPEAVAQLPPDVASRLPPSALQGGAPDTLDVVPLASAVEFYEPLMPESIRIIPFGWVVLLLVALVAAIGPADYLLLGLIRRRKLTWVLFPALCIGFTGGTVWMARHCLGTNDHRGAFVFVDLGSGGRVLRTSRYEMVYAAREFSLATPYRDALAAEMDLGTQGPNPAFHYAGYYRYGQAPDWAPFDLAGRVPEGYETHRLIQQWTPHLRRVFSIGGKGPDLGLHWDDVAVEDLRSRGANRVVDKLVGAGPFDRAIFLVNGQNMREMQRQGESYGRQEEEHKFFQDVTVRPTEGLFRFLSQVAPIGSGDFEDLSMLDSSDPNQWVLIAVQRQGDDYIVCRRLYCGGP